MIREMLQYVVSYIIPDMILPCTILLAYMLAYTPPRMLAYLLAHMVTFISLYYKVPPTKLLPSKFYFVIQNDASILLFHFNNMYYTYLLLYVTLDSYTRFLSQKSLSRTRLMQFYSLGYLWSGK